MINAGKPKFFQTNIAHRHTEATIKSNRRRYVVLDVETTGFSPRRGDRIIEIGAVTLEGETVTNEFTSLINAGRPIPRTATKVHGIIRKMLADRPQPEEVFPAFARLIRNTTLIAHNAQFDLNFLRAEFRRLGLRLPNRHRCTLNLSRRLYPNLPNHKLGTICRHLFDDIDDTAVRHRALDDARLTARLWRRMLKDARRQR